MDRLQEALEQIGETRVKMVVIHSEFNRSLTDAINNFGDLIVKLQEIERQAGIGEEK